MGNDAIEVGNQTGLRKTLQEGKHPQNNRRFFPTPALKGIAGAVEQKQTEQATNEIAQATQTCQEEIGAILQLGGNRCPPE